MYSIAYVCKIRNLCAEGENKETCIFHYIKSEKEVLHKIHTGQPSIVHKNVLIRWAKRIKNRQYAPLKFKLHYGIILITSTILYYALFRKFFISLNLFPKSIISGQNLLKSGTPAWPVPLNLQNSGPDLLTVVDFPTGRANGSALRQR